MVTMQNIGCREGESCNERIWKNVRSYEKTRKKDNPASIEIAYVSDGQVIHHGQKLDKDDYLITEGLSLKMEIKFWSYR